MRECRVFCITIQPTIRQFPARANSLKFDTAAIVSVLLYAIILSALVIYFVCGLSLSVLVVLVCLVSCYNAFIFELFYQHVFLSNAKCRDQPLHLEV